MKKCIAFILNLILVISLFSCASPSSDTTREIILSPEFARTGCYSDAFMWKKTEEFQTPAGDYPFVVIENLSQLDQFNTQASFFYPLTYNCDALPDFETLSSAYDSDFFSDNILVIVYIIESSGSIRHKLTDVYIQNSCLFACVHEILPPGGACTDDMAGWFAFVPIKKSDFESITAFCFEDENTSRNKSPTEFENIVYPKEAREPAVRVCANFSDTFVFDDQNAATLLSLCENSQYSQLEKYADDIFYIVKFKSESKFYAVNQNCDAILKIECTLDKVCVYKTVLSSENIVKMKNIMSTLKTTL